MEIDKPDTSPLDDSFPREFLSNADNLAELPESVFGLTAWSLNKPDWVAAAWRKAAGGKLFRRQSDYDAALRSAYETYRNTGRIHAGSDDGRILALIRPGPVAISRSESGEPRAGISVERSLTWSSKIRFSDPFHKAVGLQVIVLVAEYYEKDECPKWHAHLGEEYIYLLHGEIEFEYMVPKNAESFERKKHVLSEHSKNLGHRSLWLKSEILHRAKLISGPARLLIFYSDPLGQTIIRTPRFGIQGLGAQLLDDEDAIGDRLWAIYSGIGARVERVRRMRGLTNAQLATLSKMQASQLSRIEDARIGASIDTAAQLAATLDVPLAEILPDDVLTLTKGCYVNPPDPIWRMLTSEDLPSEIRDAESQRRLELSRTTNRSVDQRVQIPYLWRDCGNLLVLPSGSPRAKSMLPLVLHVRAAGTRLAPDDETPEGVRALAERNYEVLEHQRESNAYWRHASNLIIFVRVGSIALRIARYADLHSFPFFRLPEKDQASSQFARIVLGKGDLVHVNCEHLHRLEVNSPGHCSLICVVGRRRVSQAIEVATAEDLRPILPLRELDQVFFEKLAEFHKERWGVDWRDKRESSKRRSK